MHKQVWHTRFHTNRPLAAFPYPLHVAVDLVDEPSYGNRGSDRHELTRCLFKYSLRGEGRFEDASGSYAVPAGSAFLCEVANPRVRYYYPESSMDPWRFIFFAFENANQMVEELLSHFGPIYRIPRRTPIIQQFMRYRHHAGEVFDLSTGEASSLVSDLLATLVSAATPDPRSTGGGKLIKRTRRIVSNHLEAPFDTSELACRLGISREHLCRVFKLETGMTPLAYIANEKTAHAAQLLKQTSLSIKEIAGRLGHDNSSHFARFFRRITGFSPSEYRLSGTTWVG